MVQFYGGRSTPYSDGISADNIQSIDFRFSNSNLVLEEKSGIQHLNLAKCQSLVDVKDALLNWPEAEWFWVDILLGFRVKIEARSGVDQNAQAEELATAAFFPLEKWVE